MTFNTLKRRNVAEIHRVCESLIGLMAGFAFAILQATEIDGVLERPGLYVLSRQPRRVVDHGMADITVFGDDFTRAADMFTVVTPETPREIEMADVVWMCFPVRFHLGKEISLIDTLGLTNCSLNRISFLPVDFTVSSVKGIEARSDRFDGLIFSRVSLTQSSYRLSFEIWQ